jgi:hypothetical protein
MSNDCMQVSKVLGMAFTSLACTNHLLHKIQEGKLQFKDPIDVRGGLISARVLANAPINKYKNEALLQKFQKTARSINALDKALQKEKKLTPEVAGIYVKKIDKVLTKVSDLWTDVGNEVCKG